MDIKIKNVDYTYSRVRNIPVGEFFLLHDDLYIKTISNIENVGNCIKLSDGTVHTLPDDFLVLRINRRTIIKIKIKGDY